MKIRIPTILIIFALMIINTSCGDFGTSSKKVNSATSIASIRARIPTNTPMPPTPTIPPEDVVKDISTARLELEDFPEGFKLMSTDDMQQMSMTPDELAQSFTQDMVKAKAHNARGYMFQEGNNINIVLSLVIYPLTTLEASGFDVTLSDPGEFMKKFAPSSGEGGQLLEGAEGIGEKTVAIDYVVEQNGPDDIPARSQVVFSRRGNAVSMIFNLYFNSPLPAVQSIDLARALDARLEEALAK
ncbi:MAG: hypothetical protein IH586_03980 [Anaerolineaceae bacterium]|nr:hypothetical protein [Anaerolineaceae bacterium]